MRKRFLALLHILARPHVALPGALVLGAAIVGYALYATNVAPSGAYVPASLGSLTEEVDVSGTVKAAHSTDLSFETAGRVAAVNVAIGDHVQAGAVLVALGSAAQSASLAGAKAALEVQQARLASLKEGTRPEQLAIDQTALAQAEQALADAARNAYVAADDAVHVKADALFTSPRTSDARLAIQVPDASLAERVRAERVALEPLLVSWSAALASATGTPESSAASTQANLAAVGAFLDDLAAALAETQAGGSLSAAAFSADQAAVNAGRMSVSAALAAATSADTAAKGARGVLALAEAGASASDIAAQQAQVDAAQAALQSAQVALSQTVLVAPVSGTITAQNANLGQTVAPGAPLVSMIADGKFEADARVSDADIAKVRAGESVTATFDAYPGISFPATVTTVDPAASLLGGVSSYGVTVTFAENDPRLSAGASANLRIVTAAKDHALSVPTSALITSGNRYFVYVRGAKAPEQRSVEIGIQSADGRTEIMRGLSAGDEVLAFGSSVAP